MEIRYLHEITNSILPAVGDVRIVPQLLYKAVQNGQKEEVPVGKISVVKCIKMQDHHAIYEYIDENRAEAIPYEMIETWGLLSIDAAVKWILNSFMKDIIAISEKNSSGDLSNYFTMMKDLVMLSRNVLKEAEKAKKKMAKATFTE